MKGSFLTSTTLLIFIKLCDGRREEECVEVGYARSSGSAVFSAYGEVRGDVVNTWVQEDATGKPAFTGLSPLQKNITRTAQLLEVTSKRVIAVIRGTRVGKRCEDEWILQGIEKHVTPLIQLDKELAESLGLVMTFRCQVGSPYPNVDGTCVNADSPDAGSSGNKFLRLQHTKAAKDGFSPRGSVNSEKTLPSARAVASLIRKYMKDLPVTILFREVGHFIQSDTTSIPESPWTEGIDCCEAADLRDCEAILVPESDPLHKQMKCINYKRSAPAQAILGYREAVTLVSAYLDANPLYGDTDAEAFSFKTGYFGLLKQPDTLEEEESKKRKSRSGCGFPESFRGCFGLEDTDNEVEGLRLLFVMEHNYLAELLADINPHFDDALLFNEARRILIAEYNHLLYSEYLPLLLPEDMMKENDLAPGSKGPANRFIPEVNPGILSSFATSAYRNPAMMHEWRPDDGATDRLKSRHYATFLSDPYVDLLAIDVEKGRDHGLPGFVHYRKFCEKGPLKLDTWDDLKEVIDSEALEELSSLYSGELEDVDLSVALLEKRLHGKFLGKTFACLVTDQFARLKSGNKLFWEHGTSLMTEEQKTAIRKGASARAILCRHLPLTKVPLNPFLAVSESNPDVQCKDTVGFDITPWKDVSLIEVMKTVNEGKNDVKQVEQETSRLYADQSEKSEGSGFTKEIKFATRIKEEL